MFIAGDKPSGSGAADADTAAEVAAAANRGVTEPAECCSFSSFFMRFLSFLERPSMPLCLATVNSIN
jgi:hypothetical protein